MTFLRIYVLRTFWYPSGICIVYRNLNDSSRPKNGIKSWTSMTYIIGHYNPSVRIIDPVSHTTYVVCVNFMHKSTPNDRYFEKLFMAVLITLRFCARNLLRRNRRKNTFRILFWYLAWGSNPGFSSNKPTHYLLDHSDFIEELNSIFGDEAPSRTSVYRWYGEFNRSRSSLHDEFREGRPKSVIFLETIDAVHQLILQDGHVTLRQP